MVRVVKTCLVAWALAVLAYGCGSGGGSSSTTTEASLQSCPRPSQSDSLSAGGWSGKVSGISCDDAGRFIGHHALNDFQKAYKGQYNLTAIKSSAPGDYSTAGFACHYVPLPGGHGWHVTCQRAQQNVDFLVTP